MLQLTQTDNGQITGVFDSLTMKQPGRLSSDHGYLTGVVDRDQIILTVHGFLGFNNSIGGTIRRGTISFFGIDAFRRGSPSDFQKYATDLRRDADLIALAKNLGHRTQELRQTVQEAEKWIAFAELHARRIEGVKGQYQKLETQMRSLVDRERKTSDSVARTQLSVNVIQGNVAGTQTDIEVNQMWDQTIAVSGRRLSSAFAGLPPNCDAKSLRKYGAPSEAIASWQNACQQAITERPKFEEAFRRIKEQRAELKSFQARAESHRQALVAEAGRIQ